MEPTSRENFAMWTFHSPSHTSVHCNQNKTDDYTYKTLYSSIIVNIIKIWHTVSHTGTIKWANLIYSKYEIYGVTSIVIFHPKIKMKIRCFAILSQLSSFHRKLNYPNKINCVKNAFIGFIIIYLYTIIVFVIFI